MVRLESDEFRRAGAALIDELGKAGVVGFVAGVHAQQTDDLGGGAFPVAVAFSDERLEKDPALRETELESAFADAWGAIQKVVFSRTLDAVEGNARLAEALVAEEVATALGATDQDVEIGGADLGAQAIALGLVDELRMFRSPILVGGGTPFLPPVTQAVRLGLLETRKLGSRVIYERYRRARDPSG